jgi:hypothetical protein
MTPASTALPHVVFTPDAPVSHDDLPRADASRRNSVFYKGNAAKAGNQLEHPGSTFVLVIATATRAHSESLKLIGPGLARKVENHITKPVSTLINGRHVFHKSETPTTMTNGDNLKFLNPSNSRWMPEMYRR